MDATALKAQQHATWTGAAPGWRRHDARLAGITRSVSERLIAELRPGQRVLDIACGTGEPALPAAERVGPTGYVLATDFVAEMVAFAREKAVARGLANIEFRHVDGECLEVPEASFDAVTMRWGLMFMPDPVACLVRARAALKPGGAVSLACWCGPERNPWASIPLAVMRRHVELPAVAPGAPGIFAFADRARLEQTLVAAGFSDVRLDEHALVMSEFASGADYVDFTLEVAGPVAQLVAQLPAETWAVVRREIEQAAEEPTGGGVRLTGVTWIARARV
ncbi:MAG: class I SAM-dependent methyltransferase [Deltaproteobacteria bacterium]|nr:class I SAM-dependent methyltransferase [Deltaproteobacteria bacterium]